MIANERMDDYTMITKESDRAFIEKLAQETNPEVICDIFERRSKDYNTARLIYFDLGVNPELFNLKNEVLNGYSIIGASDYEKSYIFDNRYNSKSKRNIAISKTLNLDLNVLTYLRNVVQGKNLSDKQEFISYLKYIKESKFNLNMTISMLERMSKEIDLKIWSEYILAFVKYESLDNVTENTLQEYPLSNEKYEWAKEILDISKHKERQIDQLYAVACILSKSLLLKEEKIDFNTKFNKLLDYCLNELNVYLEFELYLMYKYLSNDKSVQKTFAKIQNVSKKSLDNIKNTAWDILHIRLLEKTMIDDLKNDKVIFHYIGTRDVGLQNIININPLKMIGFLDGQNIVVRKNNVLDSIKDERGKEIVESYMRKTKTVSVNYEEKYRIISEEIEQLINSYQNS